MILSESQDSLFEGSNRTFPMQAASDLHDKLVAILPTVLMALIEFVLPMLLRRNYALCGSVLR